MNEAQSGAQNFAGGWGCCGPAPGECLLPATGPRCLGKSSSTVLETTDRLSPGGPSPGLRRPFQPYGSCALSGSSAGQTFVRSSGRPPLLYGPTSSSGALLAGRDGWPPRCHRSSPPSPDGRSRRSRPARPPRGPARAAPAPAALARPPPPKLFSGRVSSGGRPRAWAPRRRGPDPRRWHRAPP